MANSTPSLHTTTAHTNPILEDDLSHGLANLNLHSSSALNNAVVPSSPSTYPQFQIPINTQLSGVSSPFLPQNTVFERFQNGTLLGLNPGITIQELQNPDAILDSFVKKAMNEKGSRDLQEFLKMRKPEFTDQVFGKLMEKSQVGVLYILHLMVNQPGSYVFQKLIDACNGQQLVSVVTHITRDSGLFVDICLTKFGSCSVIKLIKVLKKSPLVSCVVFSLAVQFERVMTEKSGWYVLSECLDQLGDTQNEMLYRSAIMNCLRMAAHKYGCILLNTFVEKIRGPLREVLMYKICQSAVFLAFDPSGNYVVQKVLDIENPEFTHRITMQLRGRYAHLSRQKAGSHLVEKCLNSTGMVTVVEDLIKSNQVLSLAEHKYGNYVIQTAYNVSKVVARISKLHSGLVGCLYPFLSRLKNGYGKNVYNLIAEDLPQAEPPQQPSMLLES